MKFSVLFFLLLESVFANEAGPNCKPLGLGSNANTSICGDRCIKNNDALYGGLVKCFDGACKIDQTFPNITLAIQVLGGEEAAINKICFDAPNACGNVFCDAQSTCIEDVGCIGPTPAPTPYVGITCEDLSFCEDGEACRAGTAVGLDGVDATCIAVTDICQQDKAEVCMDDATYTYKNQRFAATGLCDVKCGDSGAKSVVPFIPALLAVAGGGVLALMM